MIDKNSPAFRSSGKPDGDYYTDGLTIRRYYAAKAMKALIEAWGIKDLRADTITSRAFSFADAMIEFENNELKEKE